MDELIGQKCVACRAGEPTVSDSEILEYHRQIPDWKIVERNGIKRLEQVFRFRDFAQALAFTDRVGELAESEGHHPAILTEWGKVTVTWWTHTIKGLHRNDFIMAARTDQLAGLEGSANSRDDEDDSGLRWPMFRDEPANADQRSMAMGKVIVDITMSLDGFVTGPNDGPGNGLGDGGRILHEWVFEGRTEADAQLLFEEPMKTLGSCILGRRTFDIAEAAWGDNPPFGPTKVFVLTHRPHETLARGATTFIFVTDGIESALKQAQAAAGDKGVSLMGANVSQQYLKAGLVDEMEIHIANVLLGAGRPLFANIGEKQIRLERMRVIATPAVTHLRYRVLK